VLRALLVLAALAAARADAGFVGREGDLFVSLAGDARFAALGPAGVATVEGESALFGNPAGMVLRREWGFAATHLAWTDGFIGETVTAAAPAGRTGSIGGSAFLFLHDAVPVTTEVLPEGTGGLSAVVDAQVTVAGAAWLSEIVAVGASARGVHAQAGDDLTEALAVDAGALVVFTPEWTAGAAARGLGQIIKTGASRDPFPLSWDAGARYAPLELPVRGYAGFSFPAWGPMRGGVAVEGGEWYGGSVRLEADLAERGVFAYAIGLGAHHDMWSLDYTFTPAGALGLSHRFTLSIRFGRRADE
jgi:hypothetical protein